MIKERFSISELHKEYEAVNRLGGVIIPGELVSRYNEAAHVLFRHYAKEALNNLEAQANRILQPQESEHE